MPAPVEASPARSAMPAARDGDGYDPFGVLSPEVMAAAIRCGDPTPARRALLAHVMLDDGSLDRASWLELGPVFGPLLELLLDEGFRAAARCTSLASAAALHPRSCVPEILSAARSVDGIRVAELASAGPFEILWNAARGAAGTPRRAFQGTAEWRDLLRQTGGRGGSTAPLRLHR